MTDPKSHPAYWPTYGAAFQAYRSGLVNGGPAYPATMRPVEDARRYASCRASEAVAEEERAVSASEDGDLSSPPAPTPTCAMCGKPVFLSWMQQWKTVWCDLACVNAWKDQSLNTVTGR